MEPRPACGARWQRTATDRHWAGRGGTIVGRRPRSNTQACAAFRSTAPQAPGDATAAPRTPNCEWVGKGTLGGRHASRPRCAATMRALALANNTDFHAWQAATLAERLRVCTFQVAPAGPTRRPLRASSDNVGAVGRPPRRCKPPRRRRATGPRARTPAPCPSVRRPTGHRRARSRHRRRWLSTLKGRNDVIAWPFTSITGTARAGPTALPPRPPPSASTCSSRPAGRATSTRRRWC